MTTEQELCARLGLGRTPVREAVLRLSHDGLVTFMPRQGIAVKPHSTEETLLTIDLREKIEPIIIERATNLSSDLDRQRFRAIAE